MVGTILHQEFFCNHGGDDRLTQTNHIGKKKTIVAYELLIPLNNRIHLVVKPGIPLGHVKKGIAVGLQHTTGKIRHKHLNVEIVRSDIPFQIRALHRDFKVASRNLTPLGLLPQPLKLIFCKLHILVLGHLYVKLVLAFRGDAKPIAR